MPWPWFLWPALTLERLIKRASYNRTLATTIEYFVAVEVSNRRRQIRTAQVITDDSPCTCMVFNNE